MNLPPPKYVLGVAVLLPLLVCWWGGGFQAAKPTKLGVELLAVVTDDPMHRRAERSTVLNGITGLSAIFAVTNGSQDASLYFDTCAVEQKIQGEWQRTEVPPYESRVRQKRGVGAPPWSGIASDDVGGYPPGTCWNYVVAWPPGVPTNATWRLQLRYWRCASPTAMKLDDELGIDLFPRRRSGQTILTPEVRQ